ncbi:unnamed protein product [Symbiodinium sp. CCMP2592]|nr:unnamed protein product [Symbiodinium sp. CCMP2592]
MDGDLHLEISGYRISVSKAPSKAAPLPPSSGQSLESSASSFEVVDFPGSSEPSPPYSSSAVLPAPYPLQASGPRAPLDLGEAPSAVGLPSAPWLSRASSPVWVPESPLPGPPRPTPSSRAGSPPVQTPATPKQAARTGPQSLLSSPLRVPEYPLQGSPESRSQIKASFPSLTVELRDTCRNLHGGSLDWRLRALTAWEAGCWARAVLDQRVSTPNSLGSVGLPNRLYCILSAEGLDRPCVVRTFAAYKSVVGELRPGGSVSHGFPSEAEARLYFAGGVTLLEFQWPFPAAPDADGEPLTCISYVVMKRPAGFILCLPLGYLSEEETLAGQSNEEAAGIGPSLELMAPAVRLSGQGEWRVAESGELVAALVIDLPASVVGAGVPFMQEVWLPNGGRGSSTAANLQELVGFALLLAPSSSGRQLPGSGPSQVIGPPPPARQAPKTPSPMVDHEEALAVTIGAGDAEPEVPSTLASAVLAQSQALVSLVSQLAQNSSDPLLDAPSATSVRGAAGRQRLQQELQASPEVFSRRIRQNAWLWMDPSGMVAPDSPTMIRYLERYGAFSKQRNLALLAWMTATAGDQLARGSPESAADTLALLQMVLDQANLDGGDFTFAWVLLQPDLPASVFQDVSGSAGPAARAFSPLAEQKWVTICLSYMKEVEAIATRRAELQPPRKHPQPPHVPPEVPKVPPKADQEALTKKQARGSLGRKARGRKQMTSCGGVAADTPSPVHANHPVEDSPFLPGREFNFCLWSSSLVRLVLKSGTAFGHFLSTTLPLCRDPNLEVATALFPLPLPADGLFLKRSRKRSQKRRLPYLVRVAHHVLVMSLNFLHSGGKHIPPACARLRGSTLTSGRRGIQLAARHAEVLHFLRAAGLDENCYFGKVGRAASVPEFGAPLVPHLPGSPEELAPYRDLDSGRIALSGTGSWPLEEHLGPDLLMLYLEPRALRSFVPSPAPGPSFEHESRNQTLGLFRKWDALGLLGIVQGPLHTTDLVRIFGAYKDPGRDRQIGDRRNVNNKEARIVGGPSSRLPAGSLLTRLSCPLPSCALFGSCVDRQDFYHQAKVSESRGCSNAIGPVFSLRQFYGTHAYAAFLAKAEDALRSHAGACSVFQPASVLASADLPVHGTFLSLLQGDHAGVEFACAGHEGLLRSCGVLGDPAQGRLLNRCPVACRGPWTGLIIDDLFCISCERSPGLDSPAATGTSESERLLRAAKEAYEREGVPGSDHKDQFSQRVFVIAGAQVDSSPETNAAGMTLVGLPAARRLALSQASLIIASGSVAAHLWQTADQRGWYTRLGAEVSEEPPSFEDSPGVERPVACRYDFIEVRCGGPWLTEFLSASCSVGPVVDFRASPYFSLLEPRCLEWLLFMLQDDRLRSVLLVPPVGSFSPAFLPRVRAWDPPRVRVLSGRTQLEDALLRAALCVLLVATRCNAVAIVLHPLQSFARGTPEWRNLCTRRGAFEATLPGCDAFSTAPQPAVALVSAAGRPELACALSSLPVRRGTSCAGPLAAALRATLCCRPTEAEPKTGLESLLFNDVMLTSSWHVTRSWAWRDRPHINVLEARSFICALRDRAAGGRDCRFVHGLDSYVSFGLNTSDDPTRSVALRSSLLLVGSALSFSTHAFVPGDRLPLLVLPLEGFCLALATRGTLSVPKQGLAHNLAKVETASQSLRGLGPQTARRLQVRKGQVGQGNQVPGSLQGTPQSRPERGYAIDRLGPRRPLDLGSFRPGGATFLMGQTEDSELVRRRGRWASQRVMEIYIQEVQAAVYFPALPLELREKILCLAHAFTALLEQACAWKRVGVPPTSWYALFSAGERPVTGL